MSYNSNCKWFSMEYVGNPGRVPACNQTGTLELFDCATCSENPDNKKITKGDILRQMTNEELAEMFVKIENCGRYDHWLGRDGWLDWLRQEAEHGS